MQLRTAPRCSPRALKHEILKPQSHNSKVSKVSDGFGFPKANRKETDRATKSQIPQILLASRDSEGGDTGEHASSRTWEIRGDHLLGPFLKMTSEIRKPKGQKVGFGQVSLGTEVKKPQLLCEGQDACASALWREPLWALERWNPRVNNLQRLVTPPIGELDMICANTTSEKQKQLLPARLFHRSMHSPLITINKSRSFPQCHPERKLPLTWTRKWGSSPLVWCNSQGEWGNYPSATLVSLPS